MKKQTLILITASLILNAAHAQTKQDLNLDFEQTEKNFPANWESFGNKDYKIYPDSVHKKSGKFSMVIENNGETSNFRALSFKLPKNYNGKVIRLSGYIKTENVTGGYAGLWMRIDPEIGFDNMSDRGIRGTTDWKEYEVYLELNPKETDNIVIGGLLVGKGKMWLDDLKVTIDSNDLNANKTAVFTGLPFPAKKDSAFFYGSKIVIPALSADAINNLEILGRIWGFLKYHLPKVAQGYYNWDYELFRMLPGYLNAKNNQERDNILTSWIDKYGAIPACKNCDSTSKEAVIKPDLSWIDNSDLSNDVKNKLKNIYANRSQGENYYIAHWPKVGNPDFKHENAYYNMPYPDDGFRLLSVYKFWNMIQYFSPNKNLTNKKWDTILKEYIPKFINAKDELQYELAATQLVGELNDTHAILTNGTNKIAALRGNNYAPFRAEFIEDKFVVTDYYNPEFSEAAKLKIGDIITHINGNPIKSIVDSLRAYYPASNDASMLRDISRDLLRSPQKTINLTYVSDNQSKEQEVPLYERQKLNIYYSYKVNKNEKGYKKINRNIGYITLANITDADIPEIKKLLKNTKGIIIDIRNYPSIYIPFTLAPWFVSKTTPFVKFTGGNANNPGEFSFTHVGEIPAGTDRYKGKLIVLVNEVSQSAAEYAATALRAGENTTVVGSTTAGADGNVSPISLPGGLTTRISGIGVYYPNGKETQRVGIVPDVIVKPTIEGIKKGKDEVMEKAIELINK
jgi:C-terminal processing protease CtpA/Prc